MKWTPENDKAALNMKAEGADLLTIAQATGRSRASVKARLRYLSLSPEQRRSESLARHAKRGPPERTLLRHRVMPPNVNVVPAEVIEDATRRAMAPRTLTAMLMGDPPSGYSAADRRNSEARV